MNDSWSGKQKFQTVTVNGTAIALGASGTVTAAAGTLTGTTLALFAVARGEGAPPAKPDPNDPLNGFPDIFKGPLGRITAIDMNTGEHLWMVPYGDTAQAAQDAFKNNPLMKGLNVDPTCRA